MATVFLGSLEGALGFRQVVAIKRPHPHLLDDRGFRDAWLREARLASGIHHANVVDVRDVEIVGNAIQLVMDYIEGASLGDLVAARARDEGRLPASVAVRIVLDACAGLHAAHELCDDAGRPLGLVHRDVSPQNILVGVDGVARVTDFGIAKCAQASQGGDAATSREMLKGKVGYMAPEYVRGEPIDRRADVFAIGVVLWEALCGRRLFRGQSDGETLERVLTMAAPSVSEAVPELSALDAVVARALERDTGRRFATAEELAGALEREAGSAHAVARHADVGAFVRETVGEKLEERRRALREARREDTPETAGAVTVKEPRPRSRARLAIAVGGGLVLAGVGAVAMARRGSATAAATATAAAAATATAAAATASATASAIATPTPTASHRAAAPRSPARNPPPNPYPAGAAR